jgi:polygalacturonase
MISTNFLSRYPATPPTIAENDLSILQFGAVGDGKFLNTLALQKAIDTCSRKGGGKLIVPAGNFLTGTFHLKSNVHLYLEEGAVILGSPYKKDYPELFSDNPEHRKAALQTLVHAENQHNIMISGKGTINGNAQIDSTGDFQDTGNNHNRPPLLVFERCSEITVKEITFRQSLMWTAIFHYCDHVWIDGIKIKENYFYNADGVDITDCVDFLIENCDIDTDDDGICLKSGHERGCQRIVARNNRVRSLCNAFKMGTGSAGGFRDVLIENNRVWETVISGLALQIVDGGTMDNVIVRNMVMDGVGTPISIRLGNRDRGYPGQRAVQTGILRNIHISNITATVNKAKKFNTAEEAHHPYPPHTSSICGIPGHLVENVTIEDVKITINGGFPVATPDDSLLDVPEKSNKYPENRMFGTLPAYGFYIRHAKGVRLQNIGITTTQYDGRPAFVLEDVHDARFIGLKATNPKPTSLLAIRPSCSDIRIG